MDLRIEPVTTKNRSIAEQLEIHPHQRGYIEPVRDCMAEADALDAWHPVAILDGECIVGFAMYGRIPEAKYTRLWFDRLLIDRRYQRRGFARRAMELILRQMAAQYPGENICLSVYKENEAAITLYQSRGFRFTGELDTKGEKIMVLPRPNIPFQTRPASYAAPQTQQEKVAYDPDCICLP